VKDLASIRVRYMRDPLPVRLGGLAADLARVASFSKNPANLTPVSDLIREAAHFIEWCAPDADLETQVVLLDLQRHLVRWRAQLSRRFLDDAWRRWLTAEAQQWSQRVLEMSGLLKQEHKS